MIANISAVVASTIVLSWVFFLEMKDRKDGNHSPAIMGSCAAGVVAGIIAILCAILD